MGRVLRALLLILLPLWFWPGGAAAAPPRFPALTGRVVDEAGLLDPATQGRIEARLAAHEAQSSDQVVVVTLKSLEGRDIRDYGYQLGRHWGIGQKKTNNGVLLLVAPAERKVAIEVGYGLEGVFPDAFASVIVNQAVLPRFKAGDMAGGIEAGVTGILQVLTGDTAELEARARARPERPPEAVGGGALVVLIVFLVLFFWLRWRMQASAPVVFNEGTHRRRAAPPVIWTGGWGGGGWGGGGGFGGGGGGFGGGGASGGW